MAIASREICQRNGGTPEACRICDTIQPNSVVESDVLDFLRCFADGSISSFFTDPPYNWKFMGAKWDDLGSNEKYYEWVKQWGKEMHRVLRIGGSALVFGGKRTYHWLAQALKESGLQQHDDLLWIYWSGFPKGKYNLKPASEFIFYGVKNPNNLPLDEIGFTFNPDSIRLSVKKSKETLYPSNVFDVPKASKRDKTMGGKVENKHPTVKPTNLLDKIIYLTTNEGDTVIDFFAGSGSTGVSAARTCRNFILSDKDPVSVATARDRLQFAEPQCKTVL